MKQENQDMAYWASAAGLLYKKTKLNMNGEASLFKRINLEPSVTRRKDSRPVWV